VEAQHAHAVGDVAVAQEHHAGVAHRRQVLAGEERERRRVAERPDRAAVATGAVRLRRVLDQREAVPVGDLAERRQVGGLAAQVDGDDGPGALGDRRVDRGRVDVERCGIDVGEHRPGARAGNRLGGGIERVGRADHLVAGADHQPLEGQDQRVGAVRDRDRLGRAEGGGDLLLERAHVRAEDEPARVDHVAGGLLYVVEEVRVLAADVHQGDGHQNRVLSGRTAPTQ
jgi:hypothetical protein